MCRLPHQSAYSEQHLAVSAIGCVAILAGANAIKY